MQSAYMMETEKGTPAPVSLTPDQLEVLQQLLNQNKTQKIAESSDNDNNLGVLLAKQGKISHSLFSKRLSIGVWIIDTGASDHMIGDLGVLSDYELCDQSIIVFIADGTKSLVQGRGTTYVAGLSLKSVLYVPKLRHNLLLVSKFTQDKNCSVIFSPLHRVFQDISSGKRIAKAEEKGGLYQISRHDHQKEFRSLYQSSLATISEIDLMLWHQKLGHPSLEYLKSLVLFIFLSIKFRISLVKTVSLQNKLEVLTPSKPISPHNRFT